MTSGPPTAVTLTNTPETTYLSSFGAMNASTFRLYAADYYVPLDVFEFQMYDAFANAVDYVLSGDPAVIRVHFTSGVAGDVVARRAITRRTIFSRRNATRSSSRIRTSSPRD